MTAALENTSESTIRTSNKRRYFGEAESLMNNGESSLYRYILHKNSGIPYLEILRNQRVLFYFTVVLLVCTIVLINRTYSYGQLFALTC
jgi:hypothetical protein